MIVADVTFYPIGEGVSAGKAIKDAIAKLKESGLRCYPNSMATVIEAKNLLSLFSIPVYKKCRFFHANSPDSSGNLSNNS